MENLPIRALSWKQPYAQLMLHGKIETRVWPTNYRGPVLICASQSSYNEMELRQIAGRIQMERIMWLNVQILKNSGRRLSDDMKLGHAIAVGNLVDCYEMRPADADKCFVEYRLPWTVERKNKATGKVRILEKRLFCHVYENVRAIVPFPWKGSQGWRTLTAEETQLIQYL